MKGVDPDEAPSRTPMADGKTRVVAAEELSLWDFIDPLLSSWVAIGVSILIGAAIAFTIASLQSPVYEATAVARISGDQVEAVRANIHPLLENRTIAGELIREFGIVRDPAWKFLNGSAPLGADTFYRDHVTVAPVAGTSLVRISVRLGSAEKAAKVANQWVDRWNALSQRMSQQDVVDSRDNIKTQLDEAGRRLETVGADLLTLKQKSQVEVLRADTQTALDARSRLPKLQTEIEYERAFLATSEADLKATEQMLTTRRLIDRNPALMEMAKEQSKGGSVLGLEFSEQQVNQVYSSLQEQIAASRARLAGLERQRRMLVEDKRLKYLPALSSLYDRELAIARMQSRYDQALKAYGELSANYEAARIRAASRATQLQLVDPAVAPSSRLFPRAALTAQLGGVLGLLVGCFVVLGRHFLNRHRLTSRP